MQWVLKESSTQKGVYLKVPNYGAPKILTTFDDFEINEPTLSLPANRDLEGDSYDRHLQILTVTRDHLRELNRYRDDHRYIHVISQAVLGLGDSRNPEFDLRFADRYRFGFMDELRLTDALDLCRRSKRFLIEGTTFENSFSGVCSDPTQLLLPFEETTFLFLDPPTNIDGDPLMGLSIERSVLSKQSFEKLLHRYFSSRPGDMRGGEGLRQIYPKRDLNEETISAYIDDRYPDSGTSIQVVKIFSYGSVTTDIELAIYHRGQDSDLLHRLDTYDRKTPFNEPLILDTLSRLCEYLSSVSDIREDFSGERQPGNSEIPEDFHKSKISKTSGTSESSGKGTSHRYQYDVRATRVTNSKGTTFVRQAHRRGLKNARYIPKTGVV